MAEDWINKLYYGDNLDIMREHIPDESIDLIYLDPPFNSKATYNVLFQEKNGTESGAQIEAFSDTWQWGYESEQAYHELITQGSKSLANLMQALRSFLGTNDMMAYLTMMAIRLVEMHKVLKLNGSIYLHCDPTASHYLKLVMDAVFGVKCFRREIIWSLETVSGYKSMVDNWIRCHDTLLYYCKNTDEYIFNKHYLPHKEDYIARFKNVDKDGRRYRDDRSGGRKQYLDETPGRLMGDVWGDIMSFQQASTSRERLGYPTQKPEALLERIIKASSNEGDIIMDPFCGCGTTIAVAERIGRRWIGIDITNLAVTLMKHRLENAFGPDLSPYEITGDPKDLPGARALAEQDKYQFEWWALGKVGARPAQDKKKGADSGIDGYINFIDDTSGKAKTIIISVKGGHVTVSQVRDLKGVLDREQATIGAFITLNEPTKPMKEEAAAAGFYEPELFPGKLYPKLQILTIEEILNGKQLEYPSSQMAQRVTFKKAQRKSKGEEPEQGKLF